ASDESVAAERARVATEGWGARLLALQDEDGQCGRDALPAEGPPGPGPPSPATRRQLWELHGASLADLAGFLGIEAATPAAWESGEPDATDERAARYGRVVAWMWNLGTLKPEWTATTYSLLLLRDMGLDPRSEQARRAVALVRDNVKWDHDGQDFFDGEVEPCINGKAVALGAYFGEDVDGIVTRLLAEQLEDGGWNCEAENGSVRSSFHTTIDVLDGLLEYEQAGGAIDVTEARLRAQEDLLERRRVRRLATGVAGWSTGGRAGPSPSPGGGRGRRGPCSSGACSVACPPARSWTRRSRASPTRRGGTTTCCGASTTSGAPARTPTRAWRRRSRWSGRSAGPTGAGCSRTRTRAGCTSRWTRATAGRAAGTRCGL